MQTFCVFPGLPLTTEKISLSNLVLCFGPMFFGTSLGSYVSLVVDRIGNAILSKTGAKLLGLFIAFVECDNKTNHICNKFHCLILHGVLVQNAGG